MLLCVPKKCQKGERGFVPAPGAMRWSPDNRSRQMAHRGFFIRFFLSRFHPWILAKTTFPFSPTGGAGYGLWVGTGQRAELLRTRQRNNRAQKTLEHNIRQTCGHGLEPAVSRCAQYTLGPRGFIPVESNYSSDEQRKGEKLEQPELGRARTTSWQLAIVNLALRLHARTVVNVDMVGGTVAV